MARRKEWDDDDGRVIADMSGIERPRLWMPRGSGASKSPASSEEKERNREERGSWEEGEPFSPKERRIYVFAALKAALLIALVFIVGLGMAVWFMLWIWT